MQRGPCGSRSSGVGERLACLRTLQYSTRKSGICSIRRGKIAKSRPRGIAAGKVRESSDAAIFAMLRTYA